MGAPGTGLRLHATFATCLIAATVGTSWQLLAHDEREGQDTDHRPRAIPEEGYLSSTACRACHPGHYASWYDSYHRTMTTTASPDTLRAPLDGSELRAGGQVYRLRWDGERIWMASSDAITGARPGGHRPGFGAGGLGTGELPDQALEQRFPLSLITGSHHMQVLWYETGNGREMGQFPFAYLVEDRQWVPRRMIFLQPPSDLPRSERGRWNTTCIHCHTTRGQPRPNGGVFNTRATEMGIACEACHGPAQAHVDRFRDPVARYRSHLQGDGPSDIVNPSELDPRRASQICSQCHALWQFDQKGHAAFSEQGMAYRPGEDPEQSMWLVSPSRADSDERVAFVMRQAPDYIAGQYWSDGQARVSGREFHGMTDSACYTQGELSCMSCHRMHQAEDDRRPRREWANDQLDVGMHSDQACLSCHAELGADLSAHTRHAPDSAGSRCYNCHMPYTSYGLMKAIRSHKITVPTASETLATGRPNACNTCHLDRSLAWTATTLRERFGMSEPQIEGAGGPAAPLSVVHALRGDAGQRALAAWAFGWKTARRASSDTWIPAMLGVLLDDPYDAVRYIARRSLGRYPGFQDLRYDFTVAPRRRQKVAREIAGRSAGSLHEVPKGVPLDGAGQLDEAGRKLLSGRDNHPVNLLE